MQDMLEAYMDQVIDEVESIQELFNPSKDKYKINEKMKSLIKENKFRYYYITIYNTESTAEHNIGTNLPYANLNGTYKTVDNSAKIRLYGSNVRLSTGNFEKEGEIKYQYRNDVKKLLSRTLRPRCFLKDDLDPQLRQYVVFINTKVFN